MVARIKFSLLSNSIIRAALFVRLIIWEKLSGQSCQSSFGDPLSELRVVLYRWSLVHGHSLQVVRAFAGRLEACPPGRTDVTVCKVTAEKPLNNFNMSFNAIWSRYTLYRMDCEESFFHVFRFINVAHVIRIRSSSEMYCLFVQSRMYKDFIAHCSSKGLETIHMGKLETGWNWIMKSHPVECYATMKRNFSL